MPCCAQSYCCGKRSEENEVADTNAVAVVVVDQKPFLLVDQQTLISNDYQKDTLTVESKSGLHSSRGMPKPEATADDMDCWSEADGDQAVEGLRAEAAEPLDDRWMVSANYAADARRAVFVQLPPEDADSVLGDARIIPGSVKVDSQWDEERHEDVNEESNEEGSYALEHCQNGNAIRNQEIRPEWDAIRQLWSDVFSDDSGGVHDGVEWVERPDDSGGVDDDASDAAQKTEPWEDSEAGVKETRDT